LYDTNIEFEITPKMITYFTDLTPPYANIELKYILNLNSKYSIGLYNLLKADLYKQVKYGHNINY